MSKLSLKTVITLLFSTFSLLVFAQSTPDNHDKSKETGLRFSYLYGQTTIKKNVDNPGFQLGGFDAINGFEVDYFIHKPLYPWLTLKLSTGLSLQGRQYQDKKYRHLIAYTSSGVRLKLLNPIYFDADLRIGYLLPNNDILKSGFNKIDFSRYFGLHLPLSQRIGLQLGHLRSILPYEKVELPGTTFSVYRSNWQLGASIKF